MLRDDPNESSAVYLLTSDDEYAVCGTNFLPNQLLCRKYLATKFFFVEETFDHLPGNEKDQVSPKCRYRSFSLSRNQKLDWKPSSGRDQENEMF